MGCKGSEVRIFSPRPKYKRPVVKVFTNRLFLFFVPFLRSFTTVSDISAARISIRTHELKMNETSARRKGPHLLCLEGVMNQVGGRVLARRDASVVPQDAPQYESPRRAPASSLRCLGAPVWQEPSGQPREPAACGVAPPCRSTGTPSPLRRVAAPSIRPTLGAA